MGYEFYPQGLANVIRKVHADFKKEIMITENGIATDDDSRRIAYIREALHGVETCRKEGIPVTGYMYWSLLDNYEWQSGYAMRFGLVGVDRNTMERKPHESLEYLGKAGRLLNNATEE